ncbi:hypothetical protein GCM10007874_62920 [Labrys miyagiensis]|uniref:Uncharacterized protein n=2 Tax=Labrys miyagiensis TaxID=346912 RepID=A0ABQ6CUK6_9HYPH|nr:hypothetical protein GCM10007874_62920 [Labrys miyagiensis]
MKIGWQPGKWLEKKAKLGNRGLPVGTIAYYGPDDRRASKVVASVFRTSLDELDEMRKWFSDTSDVRRDGKIAGEIAAFFRAEEVRSVSMIDRIIGCPHEEGIDYPKGEACPQCPFWTGRDRWTGEKLKS